MIRGEKIIYGNIIFGRNIYWSTLGIPDLIRLDEMEKVVSTRCGFFTFVVDHFILFSGHLVILDELVARI
jgi:hypothetical protein